MNKDKKKVSVIISDVDNILIDFTESHAKATDKALERIAAVKKMSKADLTSFLEKNEKWKGYAKNVAEIITDPLDKLKPANADEDLAYAEILKDWHTDLKSSRIIEGVIITVRKIKASGAMFILYSDYPENLLLLRLANVGFPVDLVDAVYAKPDQRKASPPPAFKIKGVVSGMKDKMAKAGTKMMVLDFETTKEDVKFILKDIGCSKHNYDTALLIADSVGFDFSEINALGVNTAGVNQPDNAAAAPTVTLEKGFVDINNHFSFDQFKKAELSLARIMQSFKQRQ